MKFLHLADLHIGKKLNEYPLYEDQRFVLEQAFALAKTESVDAIVISGDIYDSSAPTAEAMDFYDWMLNSFFALGKPLLMISGNHDSAERLHVASSILKRNQVYIVTKVEDALAPIEIKGTRFYLLPYFRPSDVNRVFGTEAKTFEEAMSIMVEKMAIDPAQNNVLVTHQSILPLGSKVESSGSETALDVDALGSVGGTETIDVGLFDSFTYLALGHIHKAQFVSHNARYAGALLKYHVKEASAKRTFSVVEIDEGKAKVTEHPIALLRDLVVKEGTIEELLQGKDHQSDYVYARLLDDVAVDSPYTKLKSRYPYFLGLEYSRHRFVDTEEADYDNVEDIDKNELFASFVEKYGGRSLDEQEAEFVRDLLAQEEENK